MAINIYTNIHFLKNLKINKCDLHLILTPNLSTNNAPNAAPQSFQVVPNPTKIPRGYLPIIINIYKASRVHLD